LLHGNRTDALPLNLTLKEEAADKKLTTIAENKNVNRKAAS
jgi:hypothetical protein